VAIEIAAIVERMQTAGHAWESALDAHALAPPDANFPKRLAALSAAAADQAAAFELAARGGLGWRSRAITEEFALAPELAPGMNRPGTAELWTRFDEAVAVLAKTLAGTSVPNLAAAFAELSDIAGELATDVQTLYRAPRPVGQSPA
jgi:hypothetical protein